SYSIVHVPLEHATLAQRLCDKDRTQVFARYSLIGARSIAAGSLAAALPDMLTSVGMPRIRALQAMFYDLYGGIVPYAFAKTISITQLWARVGGEPHAGDDPTRRCASRATRSEHRLFRL